MRLEHLLSGEDDYLGLGLDPVLLCYGCLLFIENEDEAERRFCRQLEASPIAQLVRAPH